MSLRQARLAALCVILFLPAFAGPAGAAETARVFRRVGPFDLLGDGPSYFDVGVGVFDFRRTSEDDVAPEGRGELRFGKKFFFIGAALGLMANTDGGLFGYQSIYADFARGRFVMTPLLGLGGYKQGGSKDLGSVFQFRLELGLSWLLDSQSRVGIRLVHISNAHIFPSNPGVEEFLFTYAFAF
jgi:lipid A 3-O-deacylase